MRLMRFQRWMAVAALALMAVPAHAQKITATIRGLVTDPSGAVVSGAKVTLKGEDTGFTRETTTNAEGLYLFPELVVGNYRVEVESAGFKAAARSKINLSVAETRTVDFQLATGDISEVLTVESNAVAVRTEGGDVSGVVGGDQVRELPLNGRNFMQLTLLMPGVTQLENLDTRSKGLAGGSDVSVSGGSVTANMWMVDGANNNDVGSNRTILVYPSVDAIEEFKIQRNNYGAEFGGAGGAQVNLITRSGTNDFHGSAYYFARRDGPNSNDFFLERAKQPKPALKFDDFGGTFGGPIVKDKLQFFGSFEQNKDAKTNTRTGFVPTQAERNGDFSQANGCNLKAPVDPLTGQPFPGNVIPANRISPAGKALLQLYSLPNVANGGCTNYTQAVDAPVNWKEWSGRLDWTVSPSTRVMLRYTQDAWTATNTVLWGDDPFPVVGSNWDQPGKSLVAQLNQNIGNRMVNSLTFSYSANKITATRYGDESLVQTIAGATPTLFPSSGKASAGDTHPLYWGANPLPTLWNQAPWQNNQDLFVLKDDYSAVFGKHFLKVGVLGSYNKKNEQPDNASQESIQLGGAGGFVGPNGYVSRGNPTGNVIADLLLKNVTFGTSEVQRNSSVLVRWTDFEGYVSDSYKASPRLTIDAGVRLSHLTMPYMANDVYGSFDPGSVNPAFGNSVCNGMLYPPGTNPCPALGLAGGADGPNRSLQPIKALLVAPRLGFAYDLSGTGTSAIRGGVGLFYQRERVSPALGMGIAPPLSGTASETRTLDSNADVTGANATLGFGAPGSGWSQVAANPYNLQWNISYSRELLHNTTVEVSYVGNKGGDLLGTSNPNAIPAASRLAYAQTGNVALRPLNGIASIGDGNIGIWEHDRSSIYHSLQTQLVSRFGHGSSLQLSYTFAKNLTNTDLSSSAGGNGLGTLTFVDPNQPQLERGRSLVDRAHAFSGNLVLALPTFEGKSSLTRNVFGDWELSSIVSVASGYPITVFVTGVPGLSGNGGASGTGITANQRPNRVEGVDCLTNQGGNSIQWLNPAAYTLNGFQIGSVGTAGIGSCVGPTDFQMDASLVKNIRLGSRMKLQLRFEGFNIFNTVNFLGSSITASGNNNYAPQNVVFNTGDPHTATQIISAQPGGSFGQLTGARDARQFQIGARFIF